VLPSSRPSDAAAPLHLPAAEERAAARGAGAAEGAAAEEEEEVVPRLKFSDATLDIVLEDYSEKTGRTLLLSPGLPKITMTLQSQGDLTIEEYLQAIEAVLSMNQIGLLPVGEKFLKVVPIKEARKESMPIGAPSTPIGDTDRIISQMIPLKHIDLTEAQKAVDALKHAYAEVHMFERINSILVTDTEANVGKIMEILSYVDQPVTAREEPHVVVIMHAKAADVKRKLEEIIADAQKDAEAQKSTVPPLKTSGSPGVAKPEGGAPAAPEPTVPGVLRPPRAARPGVEPVEAELVAMAERGIITGKVKIVADERTNLLIIITRPENMTFFEKIIKVLDVATDPDVIAKIFRLEYADAENVAQTLNTLIGNKTEKPTEGQPAAGAKEEQGKASALKEYVEQLRAPAGTAAAEAKSKIGELSAANIKILPDKRTNSLLIMASRSDMSALEELVKSMDIMLSQVMIEVVIFKIGLTRNSERGIDWVQRALVAYEDENSRRSPIMAFAGAAGGATERKGMQSPLLGTSLANMAGASGNLAYYFTFFNLNLDAIIRLVASDSHTEVVASPNILTTDNKEATINVTKEKYFFKGLKFVSTSGSGAGEWVDDVEMRKVGTKLTVTPRINEKKFVVMEIKQSFEEEGAPQTIAGAGGPSDWPTVDSSELTASVAVRTGETIVLGGLTTRTGLDAKDRVPLVGDIPLIGRLFQRARDRGQKDETVVFITPFVLDSPEEIEAESARRREALEKRPEWPAGSGSRLRTETNAPAGPRGRIPTKTPPSATEAAPAVSSATEAVTAPEPLKAPPVEPAAQQTPAAAPQAPAESAPPAAALSPPKEPAWASDPEVVRLNAEEQKRWGKRLSKVDADAEKSLQEATPATP
jgi:general secretion pathway protein D